MHLNAHLDLDLIAVEQEDEVALMLELAAPPEMAEEMADEAELLHGLAQRAVVNDASRVGKYSDADRARKGRKRGR